MDTRDNKYKKIVDGIIDNKELEKSIGLYIDKNYENETKVDYHKLHRLRIRNSILIAAAIILLLSAFVLVVLSNSYPLTPKGVVRQYLYEIENGEFDKAEEYISSEHRVTHSFYNADEFSFKIVYNEVRNKDQSKISCVNVWIEYLDEEVEEYVFWLKKEDGKWFIISREKGNSKTSLSMGIQKYIPDEDLVRDLHVDFGYSFSDEELVKISDVIARIKVEDISYIKITSMDESIAHQESMYGNFKVLDIYHSNDGKLKKNEFLDIWVNYDPSYSNIKPPGLAQGKEYIVFLKKLKGDSPLAWKFFDYVILSDFNRYKMDYTKENEVLVRGLIESILFAGEDIYDYPAYSNELDFDFELSFGCYGKNNINTFDDTITKDLVSAGRITDGYILPDYIREKIYNMLMDMDIMNFPDDLNFSLAPNDEHVDYLYCRIVIDGNEKEVRWTVPWGFLFWGDMKTNLTEQHLQFQELVEYISKQVQESDEWKSFPDITGGYM